MKRVEKTCPECLATEIRYEDVTPEDQAIMDARAAELRATWERNQPNEADLEIARQIFAERFPNGLPAYEKCPTCGHETKKKVSDAVIGT